MSETMGKATTDFNLSASEGECEEYENNDNLSETSWDIGETKLGKFYEEEMKRDSQYDQIKQGLLALNAFQKVNEYAANRQDDEDVVAYEALLKELSDVVISFQV